MARDTSGTASANTVNSANLLPVSVTSPADIGRLVHELQLIDNTLLEHRLVKSDKTARALKSSQLMAQLVELNKLNLLRQEDRHRLGWFLQMLKDQAPILHFSFSADPSPTFLEKLITWLRREIHPNVLITVGLRPAIGAGCTVRSTNLYFDFSLRQDFTKKRGLLLDKLIPDSPSGKGAKQ